VITLVPLARIDAAAVEDLLDRAFGADRHGRTAYRVRGDASAIGALSFAAVEGDVLLGTIQCWPVALTPDGSNLAATLVMIGPVAVEPARQRDGIGRRLMAQALEAAAECDLDGAVTLIGDPEYYGRFFGFTAERTGGWRLPGPVEQRRLLARGDAVPAGPGVLGPAPEPPAVATR
jgi:predicted N-acetyltransferase YhbS